MQVTVKAGLTVKDSRQRKEMRYTFHFRTLPLSVSAGILVCRSWSIILSYLGMRTYLLFAGD